MRTSPSALRSTFIVSSVRGLSALLALLLGVVSAAYFGTSVQKDCYIIAQTVPSLLTLLLVGGIYATLIVSLTEIGEREGVAGQRAFIGSALRDLALVLAPLVLMVLAFPRPIIGLIAPGFGPAQVDLSAGLLRVTSLTMVGSVCFAALRALFESRQEFGTPGLVGLIIGLASLLTLVVLGNRLDIFALALGPLLGTGIATLLLAALAFRSLKDPPGREPTGAGPRPAARRLWTDFIIMSVGANCGQVNLLIDNAFASYLPPGSITTLGFAFVIITGAELLTVFSLADVALPRLTAAGLRGDGELGATLRTNLRYMLLLTAPLSAGAMTFGAPLSRFLFERGQFGPDATVAVARVLVCYSLEMLFMGYLALFWRLLLSRREIKVLAWTSVGSILLNAILDSLLVRPWGIAGIALATTFVTLLHALILAPVVRKHVGRIHAAGEAAFVGKVIASAALMGAAVLGWAAAFDHLFDTMAEVPRLAQVLSGLALGAASYTGLLHLMGIEETRSVTWRFLRSLGTRRDA